MPAFVIARTPPQAGDAVIILDTPGTIYTDHYKFSGSPQLEYEIRDDKTTKSASP